MMKYIYRCENCGFAMEEKSRSCPLCHHPLRKEKGETSKKGFALPSVIQRENDDVAIFYYCPKHGRMKTKICPECNETGKLCLSFLGKVAVTEDIASLNDVFTQEETEIIVKKLNDEEKNYICRGFASSYRFLVKKESAKAFAMFLLAGLFGILFLKIVLTVKGYPPAYSIFIATGNWLASSLIAAGIRYLHDAGELRYDRKSPLKIGLATGIPHLACLFASVLLALSLKNALILGWIVFPLSVVLYFIYYLISNHIKK